MIQGSVQSGGMVMIENNTALVTEYRRGVCRKGKKLL